VDAARKAVNLIMLGPPGAGKGTQAERFARVCGIPKISTGDILREAVTAGTDLGRRVKAILDSGALVGDDVMNEIVRQRLDRSDARAGFVLDGFPRTVAQARTLDDMVEGRGPLVVVDLVVPEAELVRRLSTRMICAACGADAAAFAQLAPVETLVAPPAARGGAAVETVAAVQAATELGRCRRCGGPLIQRADDDAAVVLKRLKVYHSQTEPLVDYYRARPTFRAIDGSQPPDRVADDLIAAIDAVSGGLGR
jgi:adenylate kinase